VRPTRFGLKALAFYASMVVTFYAMPYSNPFFLLLGFLTLLGVTGVLGPLRNLRELGVRFEAPEPVPSGVPTQVPVELTISAGTRFDLGVHLELASGERLTAHAPVATGDTTLALQSPALARGCYAVERAVVETRHPLGLLVCRRNVPVAPGTELIVYPNPSEALEARSRASTLEDLALGGDAAAGDLQPVSLRDHREGDGTRGIHWRASARRGRLVVQEWEGGRGQGLEVVLDRRASEEDLERALATASAIVEFARANKESLRIHSQGLSATYGAGGAPWAEALRFLAGADAVAPGGPAPPSTSSAALRLPRHERGFARAQ